MGKDPANTKGFQSVGIPHHQGLVDIHHGACAGLDIDSIILKVSSLVDPTDLVKDLDAFKSNVSVEQTRHEQSFQKSGEEALKDVADERKKRLQSYDGRPEKIRRYEAVPWIKF